MVITFSGATLTVTGASLIAIYKVVMMLLDKFKVGEKRKEYHLMKEANLCLMREVIRDNHREWTEKGYIDDDELEHIESVYKVYEGLGGNGTGARWMKELRKLPRKD